MNSPDWVMHVGWKAIAARLGVKDVRTAKALVKKYSIPTYRFGKFTRLDEPIFRMYLIEFQQINAEMAGQRGPKDWAKKA